VTGSSRLPEPLAASVERLLGKLGMPAEGQVGMREVVEAWPAAVGETVARNAWPARFATDGTLVVHTSSSAWAFELAQLEEVVRTQLGSVAPRRLRFRPGPLPEPSASLPPAAAPSSGRKAREPAAADEARAASLTAAIASPELRRAVSRAAALSLARARAECRPAGGSDTLK
jgi:hypothetical protein